MPLGIESPAPDMHIMPWPSELAVSSAIIAKVGAVASHGAPARVVVARVLDSLLHPKQSDESPLGEGIPACRPRICLT